MSDDLKIQTGIAGHDRPLFPKKPPAKGTAMKIIRFTQIADARFSETRELLETRINDIRAALAAADADVQCDPIRELQFPAEAGHAKQWRCDCTASSSSATKKAMMAPVNSVKPVYYS